MKHEHISAIASVIAAVVACVSAFIAWDALQLNQQTSVESQRVTLFGQFQDQYNTVSARFPPRILDADYRPKPGSADFGRLEAYWFFCFSEWYETNRVNRNAFHDLWDNYYTPLILDGLRIPSLKYALEEHIKARGAGDGEWHEFLREIALLAENHGEGLDQQTLQELNKQS